MSHNQQHQTIFKAQEVEFTTFFVGDLHLGIDILRVDEINRLLELTPVPQSPEFVRGVINLRGEVVTVVDLRTILGLPPTDISAAHRNVIVNDQDEQVGLLVDTIGDVMTAKTDLIEPPPANMSGIDGKFFLGVYKLDSELLVLLNVDAVLNVNNVAHAQSSFYN